MIVRRTPPVCRLLSSLLALLAMLLCSPTVPAGSDPHRNNAPEQRNKSYLLLISIDGFRWDYPDLGITPVLDHIAARGLRASALQPVFPTLTFPNHFSIATGLRPAQHGLVANDFPDDERLHWFHYKDRATVQDGGWYLAEPIWVTAERAGMLSASYYFVGTEADIDGIRPSHWYAFDPDVSGEDRVRQVLEWLSEPPELRPHIITLYFEDVDDYTHWHGVHSPESLEAIQRVDRQLGQLLEGIEALPHGNQVYLLLVSDHGMAGYRGDREPLVLDQHVDLSGIKAIDGGPFVYLYFDPEASGRLSATRDAINDIWDCGRALLPAETPAAWHITPDGRFPDLFVQADPGCAVLSTRSRQNKITPGDHGWAPEMPEMRGILYALGPRIPAGTRVGMLQVTDVYPLMLSILGLKARRPDTRPPAALTVALPGLFSTDGTH